MWSRPLIPGASVIQEELQVVRLTDFVTCSICPAGRRSRESVYLVVSPAPNSRAWWMVAKRDTTRAIPYSPSGGVIALTPSRSILSSRTRVESRANQGLTDPPQIFRGSSCLERATATRSARFSAGNKQELLQPGVVAVLLFWPFSHCVSIAIIAATALLSSHPEVFAGVRIQNLVTRGSLVVETSSSVMHQASSSPTIVSVGEFILADPCARRLKRRDKSGGGASASRPSTSSKGQSSG